MEALNKEHIEHIGISACLCGQAVRYDGGHCLIETLPRQSQRLMVCPEVLGGLSTPRAPAEIVGGDGTDVWAGRARVLNNIGEDVTEAFKLGAQLALQQLQDAGITEVWLKDKSPSCGAGQIYDGSFQGVLKTGDGVSVALFKQAGIKVIAH